ncbi:MAG: hypothetical protein JKY31_05835 [Rhodobacteraceae bacterium]|nr:hypothetical protein [Paracoccaceae bacterium]
MHEAIYAGADVVTNSCSGNVAAFIRKNRRGLLLKTGCLDDFLSREGLQKWSKNRDRIFWTVLTDKLSSDIDIDWAEEGYDHVIATEELFGSDTDRWLFFTTWLRLVRLSKARQYCRYSKTLHAPNYPILTQISRYSIHWILDEVVDLLDEFSIVLTPHQVDPDPAKDAHARMDIEITSLTYGIFDRGFVLVNNGNKGRRFVNWWADRVSKRCHYRLNIASLSVGNGVTSFRFLIESKC